MPFRAALRVVSLNAALLVAALSMIAVGGEAWLRLRHPFHLSHRPMEFSPGAGLVLAPNAEMRWTNMLDFWTVSRTNSLGFLDREPPAPELAQASCHVAFVGDSFVEGISVSVADKLPVRLEELAAEHLPHLDVATSAYGIRGAGQIAQLPWYDKWIRRLRPKLVVLVFVANDYRDNAGINPQAWLFNPEHPPMTTAIREDDGRIVLRPPTPEWQAFQSPPPPQFILYAE